MDLTKILKVGDKVYSPLFGNCIITNINLDALDSIRVKCPNGDYNTFTKEGKYYAFSPECLLFPSENTRGWSTWKTKEKCPFKPFDKVLVRNNEVAIWSSGFFSHYLYNATHLNKFAVSGLHWIQCIPYNKETQHLVGTIQECPDKYKIW